MSNSESWRNFVNSFLFANYEKLEYWVANRGVSENGMLLNYIKFPKDVNGSQLSYGFIEFIIQTIETDDKLCEQFFGPAYEKGSAEIQDNPEDISIIWNLNYYGDVDDEEYYKSLYDWEI